MPIVLISAKLNDLIAVQLLNAYAPMPESLEKVPISTLARAKQPSKAETPILSSASGKEIEVKASQPTNASSPIEESALLTTTVLLPLETTPSRNTIALRAEHPLKADAPIAETV